MKAAIERQDGADAAGQILDLLDAEWPAGDEHQDRLLAAGLVLQGMRAVDAAFTTLHPRTRTLAPSVGSLPRPPEWVERARLRRLRDGQFGARDGWRLVPNGPFSRHARGRDASSANSLQDQFPILTAAPVECKLEDRPIAVHIKVIGTDVMRGVPAAPSIGRERIRFIPLAEDISDLSFSTDRKGSQYTLDVQPAVDTAGRLIQALADGGAVDIAFAPELTVSGIHDGKIGFEIAALAANAPRIILAGSGLTDQVGDCGRPWNEARVFARGGHLLWRQRKIWPFGMQQAAALRYGFPDPGAGETLMENIAGNANLTVVDMDGFGRCIVLICQDFEGRPMVADIVDRYQPDWVLIPVLDPGVKIPGWAHQRAVGLASKSQARFLVGSSLTLSVRRGDTDEPGVGLAVGPADPTPGPGGSKILKRAVAVVHATSGPTPRSGVLVWDHASPGWRQNSVGATP